MRGRGLLAAVATVVLSAAACANDRPPNERADGAAGADGATASTPPGDADCVWPAAGHDPARTAAASCDEPDAVGLGTVDRLEQVWFAETRAEVTGAPVVTADSVVFGDWSGRVYALDRSDGSVRWTYDAPVSPEVYAGQIPASPALYELAGEPVVAIGAGRRVVVLALADGAQRWVADLGTSADPADPTETQGAPVVAGGLVIVPTDVHNRPDVRSGLVALDAATGAVRWRWDPEAGAPPGGCGSIWGAPSVDVEAGLVVVGTGSCFAEDSWTRASEAIVGVDLDDGSLRWSFQPREFNGRDWDFAGAPNLFDIGDRPVAGLGNKDGVYYVVDRTTGDLVWTARAVRPTDGPDDFAFGGFIGATVVAPDADGRLVVAGGTAVGDCPCQHGFDAASGEPRWRSTKGTGTYGASAAAGGLVFTAGVDQTLRAHDLRDGRVRWERPLAAISASGPAIAGDFVAIGVGFREPGAAATSSSGGVHGFRVLRAGERAPTTTTSTVPQGPAVRALTPDAQACVGAPCDVEFTLKDPPAGRRPTLRLEITPDPLTVRVETTDLGEPGDWLAPDGPAAGDGATVFGVFITPRDDKPELGDILCVLDDSGACTADRIDVPAESWSRVSLLALAGPDTPPTLQEGYDRLVTTQSFEPPLRPAA